MNKYFGTDGVRGVANLDLTPEFCYKIGRAAAYVLTKNNMDKAPTIIVAKDTRISGSMIESSLISGFCSVGAKVICIGIAPTPSVAYLIKKYKADAGVVISASHNPFSDNGIKFFNNFGFKLSDEIENEIEDLLEKEDALPNATGSSIGFKEDKPEYLKSYIDYLKTIINGDLSGIKVCIDCANGATYQAAPYIFRELNAEVNVINNSPNGININDKCGSTHMEELSKTVIKNGGIGIAFDGDGDRCLAIDENGEIVDGDQIMAICGNFLKNQNKLNNNTIVATVMSNLGLFNMASQNDLNILKAKVGDRYVLEQLLKGGFNFGGEQSGHIIFLDYNTTGDGILTALYLLHIVKTTGETLSNLKKIMEVLPQVLVNARVDNKKKYDYLKEPEIQAEIQNLENTFKNEGRVLIRPSGTEPIVRVMLEGKDKSVLQKYAKNLANLIEKKLS